MKPLIIIDSSMFCELEKKDIYENIKTETNNNYDVVLINSDQVRVYGIGGDKKNFVSLFVCKFFKIFGYYITINKIHK